MAKIGYEGDKISRKNWIFFGKIMYHNFQSKRQIMTARGVYIKPYMLQLSNYNIFQKLVFRTIFFGKLLFRKTFLSANYCCEYYFAIWTIFLQSGVDHLFTMFANCRSRQTYTNFATCHSVQFVCNFCKLSFRTTLGKL